MSFNKLPDNVLCHIIIGFLDYDDAIQFSRVNMSFKKLSQRSYMKRKFERRRHEGVVEKCLQRQLYGKIVDNDSPILQEFDCEFDSSGLPKLLIGGYDYKKSCHSTRAMVVSKSLVYIIHRTFDHKFLIGEVFLLRRTYGKSAIETKVLVIE